MTGAPVWVGWVIAILCISFLFAACIIYIRQVQPNFSNLSFQHQGVDKSFYLTGTAKGMEVPFCTPAYFFTGLPGGNRQYFLLLLQKNDKVLKVSAAGCCLPGPASRPSRDTCFLCLQQVALECLEWKTRKDWN